MDLRRKKKWPAPWVTLADRDVDLFQACVLDLHAPRDLDGLRAAAPGIFRRLVPCGYFLRLEYGRGSHGQPDSVTALWDDPPRASLELVHVGMSHAPDHPFTEHVLRTGDLGPLRLSDFWTRRRQLAAPVHEQAYRPLGIGWMLAVTIVRGGKPGAVTLGRPFEERDFSERDREMLRLLAPHFAQAVDAAERVTGQRAAATAALAHFGLSPRERDVASWLARGRSNAEMAGILSMSPRTVEKHVERVLRKLGVENRTAAAQVVLGLGTAISPAAAPGIARPRVALRRVLRPRRARGRR